jgi:serine/threonine protein kinase
MTETPFAAGTQFVDRYRVARVLGRGSIATVYLAHDARLGVDRAVKVPHASILAVPTVRERFLSDVQPGLHLDHPNIVRLFELGKDDKIVGGAETIFVAMELVPGGSLADFLRERGAMSQASALLAMRSVLRALQRAHGKGILHREVKPSNILIGKGGVPKLADFGFARILEIPGVREARGVALSAYLSPEQRTSARPPTIQSDVFGAGATLYSLVTGNDAAGLDDTATRARLLRAIDEPTCDLIEKATQSAPDERYASTTEFLDAIEAASASIGQAAFTDQGVDLEDRTATTTADVASVAGPFEPPPDLAEDADDPQTDPTRERRVSAPMAPPIILERAPARVAHPVSELDATSAVDASDPDSVDSFDVRELGLPLRDAGEASQDGVALDRADDIASTIRTQRVSTPSVSTLPELDDPRKKLMAVVAVVAVFLCLTLLVMLRPGGDPAGNAAGAAPTKNGAAVEQAVASPKAQASIEPVTSPDPASWRPPADLEKLEAHLRTAPWM